VKSPGAEYDYSYRTGCCPFRAYAGDERFSYSLYAPEDLSDFGAAPLIIPVHGTDRTPEVDRDRFISVAKKHGAIVLAPLFPAGVGTHEDIDDYKFLEGHGIRYDQLLLGMIEEVRAYYGCRGRLLLYGFSGGAQFVHRFALLYPELVLAASIASPGLVTLPLEDRPWWVGIEDVERRFGKPVDWEALRQVHVQLLVGGKDVHTGEITLAPDDPLWMEGWDLAGATRQDHVRALRDAWGKRGVASELEVVPNVGHDDRHLWPRAARFFGSVLGGLLTK